MTVQAAFTPEEWTKLIQAPLNVAMLITVASPSVFGGMKEMFSAAKSLTDAAKQTAPNELMGAIFATFSSQDAMKQAEPKYDTKDPYALRQAILGSIHGAVEVLDQKGTPEETQAFKDWLYQFGVQQANASKEGGFLGIGAVRVSEAEKTALTELADALGVTPVNTDPPAESTPPAQA